MTKEHYYSQNVDLNSAVKDTNKECNRLYLQLSATDETDTEKKKQRKRKTKEKQEL